MPKVTYDKKTGTSTVLNEKGKTVYYKDGTKVTYNSKGKTTYGKDGTRTVLDKKGKTTYGKDGSKTVLDKNGKTVTDKDGYKTVLDKKGKTYYTPEGDKNVMDKNGETWYWTDGDKWTLNKEGKTEYKADGSKTTYNKQGKTEYDKSGKNLTEAARLAAEKKLVEKKPVVAKEPSKTVSQIWKERTGTDWSEAKKQGLSDGSAKSNLSLLKKLNSGSLDKDKQLPAKMETVKATDMKIPYTGPTEIKGVKDIEKKKKGGAIKKMKTGGMVNSNSKIKASKKATGKVGGITKAISKVVVKTASPKGRVGGTSKAPKKAIPKAMYGASMKPQMMKKGGMTKKKK